MQPIALISGLIGALVSAALSFWVRYSLDQRAQRETEKRLAYVYLVKITDVVAVDMSIRTIVKALVPQSVRNEMAESTNSKFTPSHKISVILAEAFQKLTEEDVKSNQQYKVMPAFVKSQLESSKGLILTADQLSRLPKDVIFSINRFHSLLGSALQGEGRFEAAENLLRSALDGAKRTLPADHPEILEVQSELALDLSHERRFPEARPLFLDAARGFDVVQARRSRREKETLFKRVTAWTFYRIMGALTNHEIEANVGDFRLMSRAVVDALGQLHERHRLVRGLVSWVGFSRTTLDFVRPGRPAGETKYPLVKMLRLSVDGLTSFSAAPLRMASLLGACGLLGGLAYAVYAVYVRYRLGLAVPGWTSLVIINIFFSSIVLVCLGLVGEYVGRIFEEVKRRPLYLVRRKLD